MALLGLLCAWACIYLPQPWDPQLQAGDVAATAVGTTPGTSSVQGLAGTSVRLVGSALRRHADATGHFVLRNLPPGTFTLQLSWPAEGDAQLMDRRVFSLRERSGTRTSLDLGRITVGQPGNLAGVVQRGAGAQGVALESVVIMANGGLVAHCNAQGEFRFPGLAAGPWTLTAAAAGFQGPPVTVEVPPGGSAQVSLTLEPVAAGTGTLAAQVLLQPGPPEPAALGITVTALDATVVLNDIFAPPGLQRVLAAGSYHVELTDGAGDYLPLDLGYVPIRPGEVTDLGTLLMVLQDSTEGAPDAGADAGIPTGDAGPGVSVLTGTPGGWGYANGPAPGARLGGPTGFLDTDGGVLVADALNCVVRRLSPQGDFSLAWGLVGSNFLDTMGPALQFQQPAALTWWNGSLMVVDSAASALVQVDVTTGTGVILADFANGLDAPTSVVVGLDQQLYVASGGGHCIIRVTGVNQATPFAGTCGMAGFAPGPVGVALMDAPAGLAVQADGSLLVTDQANGCVMKVDGSGVVSTFADDCNPSTPGLFTAPTGLAISGTHIYVADAAESCLKDLASTGMTATTLAGQCGAPGFVDGTSAIAQLGAMQGLWVDGARLLVADTSNDAVRAVDFSSGVVRTVGGVASQAGVVDGMANVALLSAPAGLFRAPWGTVYLLDNANVVRSVDGQGGVLTVAGDVNNYGLMDGTLAAAWFYHPWALASSPANQLYVADRFNGVVRKVDLGTNAVTTYSPPGLPAAGLSMNPTALAATPDGFLYVGAVGAIYQVNLNTNAVAMWVGDGVQGERGGSCTGGGAPVAQVDQPEGASVEVVGGLPPEMRLYFAEPYRSRVRMVVSSSLGCQVTDLAGAPDNAGHRDDFGAAAQFEEPNTTALDGLGHLYVTDRRSHVVRRIDLATTEVTTVAGTPYLARVDSGALPAGLNAPSGLVVLPTGELLLTSEHENVVQRVVLPLP